jgi:hypothetical protein
LSPHNQQRARKCAAWQGAVTLRNLVGYIDGDGCVFTGKPATGHLRLGLQVTGTREMLLWIKSWFDAIAPFPCTANVNSMGKVHSHKIVGKKAELVLRTLLDLPTPKLERKWARVTHFLNGKEISSGV